MQCSHTGRVARVGILKEEGRREGTGEEGGGGGGEEGGGGRGGEEGRRGGRGGGRREEGRRVKGNVYVATMARTGALPTCHTGSVCFPLLVVDL